MGTRKQFITICHTIKFHIMYATETNDIYEYWILRIGVRFIGRHCVDRVGHRTSDLRFRNRGRRWDQPNHGVGETRFPRSADEIQREFWQNRRNWRKFYWMFGLDTWLHSTDENQTRFIRNHQYRCWAQIKKQYLEKIINIPSFESNYLDSDCI